MRKQDAMLQMWMVVELLTFSAGITNLFLIGANCQKELFQRCHRLL